MIRTLRTACFAAALLLPLAATAAAAPTGIQVTGTGEVQVVPDMARVSFDARREGQDAAALKAELDQVTRAVLELTAHLGIAERDVTAANVTIHPRYRPVDGEHRVDGLIVSRSIEVTLRDLDQISELINGALERGVNGIGGVRLDASNRVELERAALDLAIDDAIREAEQIAQRFNVRLGSMVHAVGSPHQVRPMMMEAMAMRDSAKSSFSPGELTISRNIDARFQVR